MVHERDELHVEAVDDLGRFDQHVLHADLAAQMRVVFRAQRTRRLGALQIGAEREQRAVARLEHRVAAALRQSNTVVMPAAATCAS